MSENVIDTSVILAIARNERIDEAAEALIDGGVMSAVNVSEVYAKLADLQLNSVIVEPLLDSLSRIAPLTLSQARLAGALRDSTRHVGLSLGDRCCLALALEIEADVYTTDHSWTKVDTGCKVHHIR